jgi:hypothetical protein
MRTKLVTVVILRGCEDEIFYEWIVVVPQFCIITLCLINAYVPFFFMLWSSWIHNTHA